MSGLEEFNFSLYFVVAKIYVIISFYLWDRQYIFVSIFLAELEFLIFWDQPCVCSYCWYWLGIFRIEFLFTSQKDYFLIFQNVHQIFLYDPLKSKLRVLSKIVLSVLVSIIEVDIGVADSDVKPEDLSATGMQYCWIFYQLIFSLKLE